MAKSSRRVELRRRKVFAWPVQAVAPFFLCVRTRFFWFGVDVALR